MSYENIDNIKKIKKYINITQKEQEILKIYFIKKSIQLKDKIVIHPKIENLKTKALELEKEINELKESLLFWQKKEHQAKKYHQNISFKMYATKKFWKHKIKKIINKEYKKDIKETNIPEKVFMDPEYNQLFETFLVDPDYRKKLKETLQNSIVYKNTKIGDYSKKKQEFKKESAQNKIKNIKKKIKELEKLKKQNHTIINIIKRLS